ncbi:uncharacterized protein pgpep1l isoform X3 [Oreochromis aureus]|uniref:uncharacterized protein pgpep1l isoform X3 n=1 Tax=Oreochromis aureus TaxID=47969 RepID=UPI001952E81C|nr:uncharacterized protein pgpep1l isoform X3 [Oreochromis aureus]
MFSCVLPASPFHVSARSPLSSLHLGSIYIYTQPASAPRDNLSLIYKRQNKPKKALSQCQKSLQLLMDCSNPERTCCVYRDMATIKQGQGHRACFQGSCHSCESWPRGVGGAQISHSLAFILSVAAEPHHNGFGPFRQFLINTSWEAAKFAVHLGLARGSSVVILEQTGKNTGYKDRDVCGYCPETRCCIEGGPQKLESVINMRVVSKHFRQAGMDVVYSRDAGRYLCDFAYYCSLYHSQGRAALIHVPTSGILASADRLVPLLQALIQKILEQLEEHSKPIDPPFVSMRSTEVTEPAALL